MKMAFFHGLDSSPQGTKGRLLMERYPGIYVPLLPADINERLRIVENDIREPMLIIGSSLGGLTALLFAMKHPELVKGLILLAPAVGFFDRTILNSEQSNALDSLYVPAGLKTFIIAGIRDEVIPLAAVRAMVDRSPEPREITLHEVDDDHNLHDHLDFMLSCIDKELGI
ncbi:MAG TPA: alpha/beta fold hydrolase [Desulfobacteraceae bacterium]|nr:alpha/beta fold hydrolase [Desulfobacteraceae bacterium]